MSEMPLYQQYPPFPVHLWSIDTPKNLRYPKADHPNFERAKKSFFDNIKKAFRLYVEVMSFYDELSNFYFDNSDSFTQKNWRDFLNEENNQEYLQDSLKNWLGTFDIKKKDWLTKFQDLYGIQLTKDQKQEIFNLIPFECLQSGQNGIRTFNNDFICLAERGFLVSENRCYRKLSLEEIEQRLTANVNNNSADNTNLSDFVNNITFDEILTTTSETLRDQQRFFIKFQHIVDKNSVDKIQDIIWELRSIWEQEEIPLIKIKYASSSTKNTDDLIIYPICLFYNQRGMYLTGYGPKPGELSYLGYYNYRLDHFQELDKNKYISRQKWDEDNDDIHWQLFDKKEELQEQKSDNIYNKLQNALGVDLHRDIKTMLLRFPQDFHKYYIENTKRHDTFKRLNVQNLRDFWQKFDRRLTQTKTTLTENEREFINQVIQKYPNDAYYMMDYRHGKEGGDNVEADVIMRLRSWGYNVEILAPADLRGRMKEDSEELWKVYKSEI